MTDVLDLDYTAAGVASDDAANWTKTTGISVLAASNPVDYGMRVNIWIQGATATRQVAGLTSGETYTVTVDCLGFEQANHWTITVEGQTAALVLGSASVEFTATGTTADLVLAFDGTVDDRNSNYAYVGSLTVGQEAPAPGGLVITGARGHLHDRIDIVTDNGTGVWDVVLATVPAYVGYTAASLELEPGRAAFIESLRAIVPAFNFNPSFHRLRWRGQVYLPDGPALVRNRRGRPHHLTIPIKAVTG